MKNERKRIIKTRQCLVHGEQDHVAVMQTAQSKVTLYRCTKCFNERELFKAPKGM